MKPRLLDLFCGAGGAARGYQQSGFYVVGVDHVSQPRYAGDEFIQADAMTFPLEGYDAIHASPPCQGYSIMHNLPWIRGREYPLLILPTLERLEAAGRPYVIENVMGARHGAKGLRKRSLEAHGLKAGWLCGEMFGLGFYRHRLFASNWFWLAPGHPKHRLPGGVAGLDVKPRHPNPVNTEWRRAHDGGNGAQRNGCAAGWRLAAEAMGIDWMTRDELTQAIPPAYCEFIGRQLIHVIANQASVQSRDLLPFDAAPPRARLVKTPVATLNAALGGGADTQQTVLGRVSGSAALKQKPADGESAG